MRLFIAINFDDDFKAGLLNIISTLKKSGIKGNLTNADNLHLTLAFLGEIEPCKVQNIISVMDGINGDTFELEAVRVASFKGREGKCRVYFAGLKENHILNILQSKLETALRERGFDIEKRVFKPHITLAREIPYPDPIVEREIEQLLPITQNVVSFELMESVRIDGRVRYKAIHTVRLISQ
jgi:2'-5' RNA ligase